MTTMMTFDQMKSDLGKKPKDRNETIMEIGGESNKSQDMNDMSTDMFN